MVRIYHADDTVDDPDRAYFIVGIQVSAYVILCEYQIASHGGCSRSRYIASGPHIFEISQNLGVEDICHIKIIQRQKTFELLPSIVLLCYIIRLKYFVRNLEYCNINRETELK